MLATTNPPSNFACINPSTLSIALYGIKLDAFFKKVHVAHVTHVCAKSKQASVQQTANTFGATASTMWKHCGTPRKLEAAAWSKAYYRVRKGSDSFDAWFRSIAVRAVAGSGTTKICQLHCHIMQNFREALQQSLPAQQASYVCKVEVQSKAPFSYEYL